MFWNKYPYTDFHELNLDMILKLMKELHAEWSEFTALNKITNAGAWDITKQYQAWTVVSDNNVGYISLKPVPAGIAITNTEYWGVIADYDILITDLSGRISALESQMNTLNNTTIPNINNAISGLDSRLDDIENPIYVFIGDSYADGVGTAESWCKYAADYMGLTENVNYFKNSMTSTGFCATYLDKNFQALMEDLAGTMTDDQKNRVKAVTVGGGFNDKGYQIADINDAIYNFVQSAKTRFPNAVVYIGCIGWSTRAADRNSIMKRSVCGYSMCYMAGAVYINNSEYLLHNYSLIQADTTHPTDVGAKYIGYAIGGFLLGKSCSMSVQREVGSITPDTSIWATIQNGMYIVQDNAMTGCDLYNLRLDITGGVGNLAANYDYPLGTWNSNLMRGGKGTEDFTCIANGAALVVYNDGVTIETCPFWIYLGGDYGQDATIRFGSIGNKTTFNNVVRVILRGATGAFPTLYC